MHIRVTPASVQPGKVQETVPIMRELFDRYRQSGGFRGGYLAADERSGEGMAVTLWDSEEAAQTATQGAGQTLAKLGPLMASGQTPVPPRAYEVLLHSEG